MMITPYGTVTTFALVWLLFRVLPMMSSNYMLVTGVWRCDPRAEVSM